MSAADKTYIGCQGFGQVIGCTICKAKLYRKLPMLKRNIVKLTLLRDSPQIHLRKQTLQPIELQKRKLP